MNLTLSILATFSNRVISVWQVELRIVLLSFRSCCSSSALVQRLMNAMKRRMDEAQRAVSPLVHHTVITFKPFHTET